MLLIYVIDLFNTKVLWSTRKEKINDKHISGKYVFYINTSYTKYFKEFST